MTYRAAPGRYERMPYARCGRSGLLLPRLSLGLWHNFGAADDAVTARALVLRAFDLGITHFDLADVYGPPSGSAEQAFGRILREDLTAHRDELIVSTKAGHRFGPGPYGDWASRKHLLASLDASLHRMGLDYVDIFYSHRPDPHTPLEETMRALADAVRSGKALYAGISKYPAERSVEAFRLLADMGVPCLIHQDEYSMFHRAPEHGLFDVLEREGVGCILFSPLAQGLLTARYLDGIPAGSRAARPGTFLPAEAVTEDVVTRVRGLNAIARQRGQTLAQMALAWALRPAPVVSAIVGASRIAQLEENVAALDAPPLTPDELTAIETILAAEPA